MSNSRPTVGADPELFLIDVRGKFISSIGLIGGSKAKPRDIGQGCAVQEDNVAVEFNIAPALDADHFVNSCKYALEALTKEVAEKNLFLSITASKAFDADQLTTNAAKHFGCDPDYNAWTKHKNPTPKAPNEALRSCGGHVHIGTPLNKLQVIRWCDVTMGLASVIEDPDMERRLLYGKAGAFRGKSYGVEYRTLSNYWLKSTKLMEAIYNRAIMAVHAVERGYMLDDEDGTAIQHCINTGDKKAADDLMVHYQIRHSSLRLEVV